MNYRVIGIVLLLLSPWMIVGGPRHLWSQLCDGWLHPEQFNFLGGALTLIALIGFVNWPRTNEASKREPSETNERTVADECAAEPTGIVSDEAYWERRRKRPDKNPDQ
jgi:hypothetical protein